MFTGLSRLACQAWTRRFNGAGLAGLEDRPGGGREAPLTPGQEEWMQERPDASPAETDGVSSLRGADIREILDKQFGVQRSLPAICNWLHRLSYSHSRPRPRHRKNDPHAQAEFSEQFPHRIEEVMPAHPGCRLRVFLQYESRFGQQGITTNAWASKGSRRTTICQTEYEYLWVGLPRNRTKRGAAAPSVEHGRNQRVLRQFSKRVTPDEHAVMIWDGASFHTSKRLKVLRNITILQAPPYSPELNPLENLWHYLKSRYWSNRAYQDYEQLEESTALGPELMMTVHAAPGIRNAASTGMRISYSLSALCLHEAENATLASGKPHAI